MHPGGRGWCHSHRRASCNQVAFLWCPPAGLRSPLVLIAVGSNVGERLPSPVRAGQMREQLVRPLVPLSVVRRVGPGSQVTDCCGRLRGPPSPVGCSHLQVSRGHGPRNRLVARFPLVGEGTRNVAVHVTTAVWLAQPGCHIILQLLEATLTISGKPVSLGFPVQPGAASRRI